MIILCLSNLDYYSVQTHAVLRQAWVERVRPCLVLNKMDRLILDLGMNPNEANRHLAQILEQVNEIQSSFVTADAMRGAGSGWQDATTANSSSSSSEREEAAAAAAGDEAAEDHNLIFDAESEARSRFSPAAGNVLFASALDGWAFRIDQVNHVAECVIV